jgi:hypothetical protein
MGGGRGLAVVLSSPAVAGIQWSGPRYGLCSPYGIRVSGWVVHLDRRLKAKAVFR